MVSITSIIINYYALAKKESYLFEKVINTYLGMTMCLQGSLASGLVGGETLMSDVRRLMQDVKSQALVII
jgi:hypothetical protein